MNTQNQAEAFIPIYDFKYDGEQLTLFGRTVIDDTVILDGSSATIGVRLDELDIEIFEPNGHFEGHYFVEVYPLDGKNRPVIIDVPYFVSSDEAGVRGLVHFALQLRQLNDAN